jgi:ribosomal protein S18 acetylase RimI-like enzyme
VTIELRPAVPGDEIFLEHVYFTTQRWITERLFGWRGDDFERCRFRENHELSKAEVIVVDGTSAGWLIKNTLEDAIEIGSIYVLPDYQRKGIGTEIMSGIIKKAASLNVTVRLSTAKINPARALYERLGFHIVSESQYKISFEYNANEGRT